MPALGLVPAAGRAERFGSQKLVALVGGERLLDRTILTLLGAGLETVIVVTAPRAVLDDVRFLADPRVRRVVNPDPTRGMLSSIQAGLAGAPAGDPIVLLPGDMPFVQPSTVTALLAAPPASGRVRVARFEGRRGHPLALPRSLGNEILKADAGANLSELLTGLGIVREYVDVADPGVVRDVDVPGDLT
jgi:molybdenum cofactor cytidylyltransferase